MINWCCFGVLFFLNTSILNAILEIKKFSTQYYNSVESKNNSKTINDNCSTCVCQLSKSLMAKLDSLTPKMTDPRTEWH